MASLNYILVLILISLSYSLAADPTAQYCNQNTLTTSTTILSNIDNLLANLVSPFEQGTNFVESSYGQDKKTKVYGLAQCRGDVPQPDCLECIQDAAKQIKKLCPYQTDSRIWYDYCLLRYSQNKFYGQVDTSVGELYANTQNVSDPDSFNQELGNLFGKIDSQAVKPGNNGLAKDKKKLTDFETLYGLVQCQRDLSPLNCAQCLAIAIDNFQGFCFEKKGCRVFYTGCFVRYELYPFYYPLDSAETKDVTWIKSNVHV